MSAWFVALVTVSSIFGAAYVGVRLHDSLGPSAHGAALFVAGLIAGSTLVSAARRS